MLKKQKVFDNPRRPAADFIASLSAEIGDLLGDVAEVQRQIRPGAGKRRNSFAWSCVQA
jgi:hypothetical protein